MTDRPIADVESVAEKARRERAAKLRELMEHQWKHGPVAKARGRCRWTMPMSLGSDHGREDDISPS